MSKKRILSEIDLSESEASLGATLSDTCTEPPMKRQRHNHNNNHNTNGRQHPHYQKFADSLKDINPWTNTDFRNSIINNNNNANDDCIITHASIDTFGCYDCKLKDKQITKNKKETAELREKLKILQNLATSGFKPRYSKIPMNKNNGITTHGLGLIKNKLMRIYNPNILNVSIKKAEHKRYKCAIITFLKKNKNGTNQTNNSNSYRCNIAVSLKNKNNNNNNNKKKYNFQKQAHVFRLKDQNGQDSDGEFAGNIENNMSNTVLYSTMTVMKRTVIGEYLGIYMTQEEFDDIYNMSDKKSLANLYAFDEQISMVGYDEIDGNNVLIDSDDDIEEEKEENDNELLGNAENDLRKHDGKFVIDAVGYQSYRSGEDHLLMYIPHVEESKANVEYVTAVVNGWPRIFFVTKKKIGKNKGLSANFNPEFEVAKFETERENLRKERVENLVENILKMPLFGMTDQR